MEEILRILLSLGTPVYHLEAERNAKPPYLVYQEISQGEILSADNSQDEYAVTGTVDIFSKNGKEPLVRQLREAFDENEISFWVKSVQYEEDTGLIHTEFEFDAIGGEDECPL